MVMWVRESRMARIAICGALPHLMPIRRTSSTAAGNEARQVIHISSILPMRLSIPHCNWPSVGQLQ